jgi:cyclopropane fatty-acyl-phospholipid synthase-like methyltransferase
MPALSSRLQKIADSLPLKPGMRILEIGCGPGALARQICHKIGSGYVLGIDRSEKAIKQANELCQPEIKKGMLEFKKLAIEDYELEKGEEKFDLILGIRVGALDGRHPKIGAIAFPKIAKALKTNAKFFIDSGAALKEINLDQYRK